tara:strand:+ start:787 stop:1101 length:315 start_codon:yes stop_codon:yes gene_type:complete
MPASAVRWAIMTRVAFFPSRCQAEHHDLLQQVADYAEVCLLKRYGSELNDHLHTCLEWHWHDITKHVGKRRRHVLGLYPGTSVSLRSQAAEEAAKKVALRKNDR